MCTEGMNITNHAVLGVDVKSRKPKVQLGTISVRVFRVSQESSHINSCATACVMKVLAITRNRLPAETSGLHKVKCRLRKFAGRATLPVCTHYYTVKHVR